MLRKDGIHFYLVIGLFAVYMINGLIAIPKNSVTYDEMDHWSYGKRILMRKPQLVYPYDDAGISPFLGINALPRAVQQLKNPQLRKTDGGFSDIMQGRYVTLIICLLLGFFIYKWSKELYGNSAGLFSLFMFVFCPNLNGHAILLASDAYTALFLITTLYYFWKFVREPVIKDFLLFSVSFALALLIKYSMVHLLAIVAVISLLVLLKRKTLISNWKKNLARLAIFLVIQLLVINIAFQFNGSGQPLKDHQFHSAFFQAIQSSPAINKIPVPLPAPYVEGFDIMYHMLELGAGNPLVSGVNYLLGEQKTGEGFWDYYFVVLLFKTPIPYLFVLLITAWLLLRKKKFSVDSATFIISFAGLYLLLLFSFVNKVQIGIRHVIFLFPLLYVLAGKVTQVPWKVPVKQVALYLFCLYTLATYYFYFPNLLSYTNELITNKKNAYKIMADSNLDYGQGNFAVARFLEENKDVNFADTIPATGKFIISVNDFLDLNRTGKYRWLKNLKPTGHVDFCYLLFDIKKQDLEKIPPGYFIRRDSLGRGGD